MKQQPYASPLTWRPIHVTKLTRDEQQDHQELLLDVEGLAIWETLPSYSERHQDRKRQQKHTGGEA